jgi:hypothetical protein
MSHPVCVVYVAVVNETERPVAKFVVEVTGKHEVSRPWLAEEFMDFPPV